MKIAESQQKTFIYETFNKTNNTYLEIIIEAFCQLFKRPARDACLCMGELPAPPAPHFVFLITL